MPFQPPRLSDKTALIVILLCLAAGFFLRAKSLGLTAYNIDESSICIFASKVWKFTELGSDVGLPLRGLETSLGFHNPPTFVYLMAPFFLLTEDPRFAMFGLAMAGSAAIVLAAMACWRLWGAWAGVAAAVLCAFSPNAIDHSRRLWGHDTIIAWSALSIYCAIRSIQKGRKRWMWTSLAAAACAQGCHLSGIILWIVPVGALVFFRPAHWKKTLAAGGVFLALVYAPLVFHDIAIRTDEEPSGVELFLRAATGTRAEPARPSQIPAVISWLTVLVDSGHNDQFGPDYAAFLFSSRFLSIVFAIAQGLMASLVLAGLAALLHVIRSPLKSDPDQRTWCALLAAQMLASAILFTILPVEAVPPYQLPAFIPAVMGASYFLSRSGRFLAGLRRKQQSLNADTPLTTALLWSVLGFMLLFGTAFTLKSRSYLRSATPLDHVSSVLQFKLDSIAHIVREAGKEGYAIMQDGRAPLPNGQGAPVDYWVLWLHYYLGKDASVPNDPTAPVIFLLLDSKTILRPEVSRWLSGKPYESYGTISIFRLEDASASEWRSLVTQYPPAPAN